MAIVYGNQTCNTIRECLWEHNDNQYLVIINIQQNKAVRNARVKMYSYYVHAKRENFVLPFVLFAPNKPLRPAKSAFSVLQLRVAQTRREEREFHCAGAK